MNDLVLVVDDDVSVLQLFELTLVQSGLKAAAASSGGEALAKIEELKPKLVLLDMMLPDYGGMELLELMRRRDPAQAPSVIVITGRFSDQAFKDAIRREPNVVAYLEKPVRPQDLLKHVRDFFGATPTRPAAAR